MRRLVYAIIAIFSAVTIVFFLTRVVGDPTDLLLPLDAPEEVRVQMREALGLNESKFEQYVAFLLDAVRGDFGESIWQRRPAATVVIERLPATFLLAGATMAVSVLLAYLLGTLAAIFRSSWVDRLISALSVFGISVVNFWLGIMLILIFSVTLGWLPTSGYGDWRHLVLPVLALSALTTGRLTQVVRQSVLEEFDKPYILAARARGASTFHVVLRHVLKNTGVPVATIGGWELVRLLAGYTVAVETVFGWPGVGYLAFEALAHFDYPVIMADVMFVAILVAVINLLVDVLYALLDPRIRTT
jgi:peptide/nickel transport system permease protein